MKCEGLQLLDCVIFPGPFDERPAELHGLVELMPSGLFEHQKAEDCLILESHVPGYEQIFLFVLCVRCR